MNASITFLLNDEDVPALRDAVVQIARVGYCEKKIRERLGLLEINDLLWRALPIYRKEYLSNRDALTSAIDLFLLQGIIPVQEVNQLFDSFDWSVLVRVGVLSMDADGLVRAHLALFPVGTRLIFSEHAWPKLPHPGVTEIPHDRVMFVGADSHWLARSTIRRPIQQALDLCTGSGIHALLAAAHAQRVVAVDINPRAALCTQFNAKALGLPNITVKVGDLFAPVGDNVRFDLITANPPFVPSPLESLGFRDGGRSGEDIQRRIVAGLPQYLAAGGSAQIVTELGERDHESLTDRIREWLCGAPMDIHILRLREYSTQTYALGHAEGEDYGEFLESVNAWHENLREQRYDRIVAVLLTLQWSDPACGAPWARSEESKPPSSDSAGVEIEASFAAERLSRRPDLYHTLQQSHVQRVPQISLVEAGVFGAEAHVRTNAQILGRSLAIQQWISPLEREILVRMGESQSSSELLGLADTLDLNEAIIFAAIRSLLQRGLISLKPASNRIG